MFSLLIALLTYMALILHKKDTGSDMTEPAFHLWGRERERMWILKW